MNPGAFVPEILRRYDREKPWAEWLHGAVLFADVSGFTPMSEALSVLGAEGAEILTSKLNRTFTAMIRIIHALGGDVMKFGGDALLCFFPEEQAPGARSRMPDAGIRAALSAAVRMQYAMGRLGRIRTPVKKFTLQMKIGVANGEVMLGAIGDPAARCDTVFAGRPVDLASRAEHNARPGDIVLATNDPLRINGIKCSSLGQGFYRLRDSGFGVTGSGFGAQERQRDLEVDRSFLIGGIYDMVQQGYEQHAGALLRIVPAFLQFSGFHYTKRKLQLQRLHDFFASVLRITHEHGGQLNGISMGDKGSVLLLLFGAPHGIERKEERACQWSLEVERMTRADFPELRLRTGMSTGRVFAGIVGGSGRFDYTVMGDTVNLASRLMQGALPHQICVNEEFTWAAEAQFEFRSLGARQIKGKTAPLRVFALAARRPAHKESPSTTVLVGRQAEIEQLQSHLRAVRRGVPRFVVIEGEAGQGKSLLGRRILEIARQDGWRVVSSEGEITTRSHSYAPWDSVFAQSGLRIADFGIGDSGLGAWGPGRNPKSGMDEHSRKSLLHHQLCSALLKKLSSPSILFLDDLHWFDTLSLELLASLLNRLRKEPLLILGAGRSQWAKSDFVNRSTFHVLSLVEMDRSLLKEMTQLHLGGPVRDALVDFLYDRSHGNPFFAKQVLDYLKATDLLTTRLGEWTIQRMAEVHENVSGEDVVIARLDQLTLAEKEHLELAACMGPSFYISVLQQALGGSFQSAAFDSLQTLGYFQRLGNDRITFPHALVQETLYHDLPQKVRRQNHRKIALAMESVFEKRPDSVLPNLANHFSLANIRDKAIHYSIAAGDGLSKALSFPEAAHFFKQAYLLLGSDHGPHKWETGLKLAENLLRGGHLKEALTLANRLRTATKQPQLTGIHLKCCCIQFDAMRRLGRYGYITRARRLLLSGQYRNLAESAQINYLIGAGYFHRGLLDSAHQYLTAALSQAKKESDPEIQISSWLFLAGINKTLRNYSQAIHTLHKGLSLAQKNGNFYQELKIRIEIANVLTESGRFEEAIEAFSKLLPQAENAGEFFLTATVFANLGILEIDMKEWANAEKHLQEATSIFLSLGAIKHYAEAVLQSGCLSFYQGKFHNALDCYLKAVRLLEKTGERIQICWAYYNTAEVLAKLQRRDEALRLLHKGLKSFRPEDDPPLARMYEELRQSLHSGKSLDSRSRPQ